MLSPLCSWGKRETERDAHLLCFCYLFLFTVCASFTFPPLFFSLSLFLFLSLLSFYAPLSLTIPSCTCDPFFAFFPLSLRFSLPSPIAFRYTHVCVCVCARVCVCEECHQTEEMHVKLSLCSFWFPSFTRVYTRTHIRTHTHTHSLSFSLYSFFFLYGGAGWAAPFTFSVSLIASPAQTPLSPLPTLYRLFDFSLSFFLLCLCAVGVAAGRGGKGGSSYS